MGFLAILGCLAIFGIKSLIGVIIAVPLSILLYGAYRKLQKHRNHSLKRLRKTALISGLSFCLAAFLYFFGALDLSGIHSGSFACPVLINNAGYYWPATYLLILFVSCFVGSPESN